MSMNCFKIPKINKAYLQAPNSVCSCENITLYKCMNEAIYTKKNFHGLKTMWPDQTIYGKANNYLDFHFPSVVS